MRCELRALFPQFTNEIIYHFADFNYLRVELIIVFPSKIIEIMG